MIDSHNNLMSCRVRCTQIHGPGTILLGDAAHAVTPIGGQGCNAALEDGQVLDQVLRETGLLSHLLSKIKSVMPWTACLTSVQLRHSFELYANTLILCLCGDCLLQQKQADRSSSDDISSMQMET